MCVLFPSAISSVILNELFTLSAGGAITTPGERAEGSWILVAHVSPASSRFVEGWVEEGRTI